MAVCVAVAGVIYVDCVSGFVHTRSLFGEEYCYIMDAKSVGNLGRYLNVRLCLTLVFIAVLQNNNVSSQIRPVHLLAFS